MNLEHIQQIIKQIITSPDYERDFGYKTPKSIASEGIEDNGHLSHYFLFLEKIGSGELDASFYIEDAPVLCTDIYGNHRNDLEHLLIFATDQSEYSFAFDTKNKYTVIDIDASGEISNTNYGTFDNFITMKLNQILDFIDFRTQHSS